MTKEVNRILVVSDCSNFEYVCIYSAVKKWTETKPEDAIILNSAEDTDQSNLPNLLNFSSFRRILHTTVQKKLDSLTWIVRNNHPNEVMMADGMDFIFTVDDKLEKNFRKVKYQEYKAQRKLVKKQYDVFQIKKYIENVIFKELRIEEDLGYRIIGVENCESDDIIAVLMKRFDNYICRILISSDRDFLQLENVNQYDMFGTKIKCGFKHNGSFYEMTPKNFLLWKILRGDISDNIKNVFPRCGKIMAYKLTNDKDTLKKLLTEDSSKAKNFMMNKFLIDFSSIPKETEEKIFSVLKESLDKTATYSDDFDINNCITI